MNLFICILALTGIAMADETNIDEVLKQGNDKFTARMFSEVVKINPGKSVVMSPFSVLPPLGQLALASAGESHDELLRAIGLPNDEVTKSVFSNVNRQLRSVKGVDLRMANRIYIAENAKLNDNFAALSRDIFDSDVKNVDFVKNTETAEAINSWVEEKTNNKIKDLVDPSSLSGDTRAVLVNAIYFKGSWKNKFDKELTTDSDFHVTKDMTVKVPTMRKRGDFRYAESTELDAKLLELPYEGDESSFLIVLPNKIDGITDLEDKLKVPALLEKATQNMYTSEVDVTIPKFKIETSTNLKEVLQKMEIKKMFSAAEANLNNLLKDESNLYVSDAIQKAFIEVNEEGAEATAANAFFILESAFVSEPLTFIADKPFYFELRHKATPLFSGIFVQPSK